MMMRFLNICVIVALVLAAADVYKIKFESTRQAQRVAKLRMEIRREQDAVAALRVEGRQVDRLDNLPERPPDLVPVGEPDPIGTVIANPDVLDRTTTGSLPGAKR